MYNGKLDHGVSGGGGGGPAAVAAVAVAAVAKLDDKLQQKRPATRALTGRMTECDDNTTTNHRMDQQKQAVVLAAIATAMTAATTATTKQRRNSKCNGAGDGQQRTVRWQRDGEDSNGRHNSNKTVPRRRLMARQQL